LGAIGVAPILIAEELVTQKHLSSQDLNFGGLGAGVMMAFAFQLLLTNFSVAFGFHPLGGANQILIMKQKA